MSTTIVALATPPGIGAIHVIRISGKDAFKIVNKITKDKVEKTQDRIQITFLKSRNNQFLDQVVLSKFFAPNSYTGEDCVEISCHGNNLISKLIIDELIKNGAVQAERGEFTKRAFLNNKIDLNQAINIGNLFKATSESDVYSSVQEIMGCTSNLIKGYLNRLFNLISECELNIDYPDELNRESKNFYSFLLNSIKDLHEELNLLFINSKKQKLSNYRIVFIGNSNSGKSSLVNYLIGKERIIVSDKAGTTTDSIEVDWCFGNYIVTLVDTAGLDSVQDLNDYEFARRTKLELENADLLVHLTSMETSNLEKNKEFWINLIGKKDCIYLKTKNDLCLNLKPKNSISVNNKDVNFLFNELEKFLEKNYKLVGIKSSWGVNNLKNACLELEEILNKNLSIDLISEHLHVAFDFLSKIIKENISTSEKINMMFDNFCVGK